MNLLFWQLSKGGVKKKGVRNTRQSVRKCMCACVSVHVCVCEEALAFSERVCFFHCAGPQAWGRVRRSSGEAQHGAGCFSWTRCTVTALRAGGHRVQHSSRALSVYMTAAEPGGGGSSTYLYYQIKHIYGYHLTRRVVLSNSFFKLQAVPSVFFLLSLTVLGSSNRKQDQFTKEKSLCGAYSISEKWEHHIFKNILYIFMGHQWKYDAFMRSN